MTYPEFLKKYRRRKILSLPEAEERRQDLMAVLASRTVKQIQIARDLKVSRQRINQLAVRARG